MTATIAEVRRGPRPRASQALAKYPDFLTDGLAACAAWPNLFVRGHGERTAGRRKREAAAQTICAPCPLKAKCAAWGFDNHQAGIWGGLTDKQRTAMRERGERP